MYRPAPTPRVSFLGWYMPPTHLVAAQVSSGDRSPTGHRENRDRESKSDYVSAWRAGAQPTVQRHRVRPRMAGRWHVVPARVLAPHFGARLRSPSLVSPCFMGLISKFCRPPGVGSAPFGGFHRRDRRSGLSPPRSMPIGPALGMKPCVHSRLGPKGQDYGTRRFGPAAPSAAPRR
jgi:hypothetical protein